MASTFSGPTPDLAEIAWLSPRHVAFAVPILLLHGGCALVFAVGASRAAVAAYATTALIQIFGITAGYHRLLAHRSFETSRAFRFALALCGVLAGQNGPLWWVGHHRHHHRHADEAEDAHSPRAGFFWSHMGWLLSPRCVRGRRHLVPDLEAALELRLLEKYSYLVNLAHAALLYLTGEIARGCGVATNGFQLVVWGCAASTVSVYHIIWSANSVCHRFGTRRFRTADDSRNNPIVALLTLGDGWHHNHHYRPFSARHGFLWWEIDINYAILKALAAIGVVWNMRVPHESGRSATGPNFTNSRKGPSRIASRPVSPEP